MNTRFFAILLLACISALRADELVADRVDWPTMMAQHDMRWSRLPRGAYAAPHFGNATVGSMLYARTDDQLEIEVFRNDVCDHRDNSFGPTPYSRPRLRIGSFALRTAGKIKGISWRKDLWNAELTGVIQTEGGEIRIRHFVDADEPAIVTELWTSESESSSQWTWTAQKAETPRKAPPYPKGADDIKAINAFIGQYGEVYRGKLQFSQPNPEGRLEKLGGTHVWVQDLLFGGQYATAWTEVDLGKGHRVHIASIANRYPERTASDEAVKTVTNCSKRDLDAATARHREWWHHYYRQSFVSIPDSKLESLYWQTIYRYGCCARQGRYVMDVPGIWNQGGNWCYITADMDMQAGLWAVYTANRLETGGELLEMLHRGRESLMKNVRPVEWQADSAYLDVQSQFDLIGPRDQDKRFWDAVGCLPYALHNGWWQYRYSMDDNMLREKLFPLLRRAMNLYLHMLKEEEGRLHLPRTYSPEVGTFDDCNFDLALLRWGCQTLLWSAQRLKLDDPLIPKWHDLLSLLVDFPVDENGFRIGRRQSEENRSLHDAKKNLGKDVASSPHNHRHASHLMMIYPLHLVTIDQPGMESLLRHSVERFCASPTSPSMIATHGVPLAASIGDGELALHGLKRQAGNLDSNGLAWGASVINYSVSFANGVQTMLLQSWGDTIRVFPAVPKSWSDAVFHDLRAEGAFLVSAERKGGKTQWVRVKSLAGEPCRIAPGLVGKVNCTVPIHPVGEGRYALTLAKGGEALFYVGEVPHPVVQALPPMQAGRIIGD